jgi:hypothetical protein
MEDLHKTAQPTLSRSINFGRFANQLNKSRWEINMKNTQWASYLIRKENIFCNA